MTPAELHERLPGLSPGRRILAEALAQHARPEQELTVSEWADRYRKVSAESGSRYPGPWSTARTPYLREPMDCLHPDHPARRVALKFSAQTGKSEIPVNWFGFIVDRAPGTMLMVLPSLDEAIKFNRVKIQPTVDASPQIRHRVRPENARDEASSTTSFKRFSGGFAQIVTASSSKGLQMVSIRYLVMDEVSEYPLDTDGRGSPIDQARARQKSYSDGDLAKEFASSTPGLAGTCRITGMYEDGDRRRFYVACPHCGDRQTLRWENMQPPSETTRRRVTFNCVSCGQFIDQVEREAMLATGEWIPTRSNDPSQELPGAIYDPVPEHFPPEDLAKWSCAPCEGRCRDWQPSYALWSAYSPMESWGDIYARGVAAKGDPLKEKTFCQQDLGEPYDPTSDAPDHERLMAVRRFWPKGTVPFPAAVVSGFIDVQESGTFEWAVWGWGPGFQGWLVDCGIIIRSGDIDADFAILDALCARTFPTEAGVELTPIAWGIDTGNETQLLYDKVAGRPWLTATKGVGKNKAPPLFMSKAQLKDGFGRAIPGRIIDLGLIGTFDLKSAVYKGLKALAAGPREDGSYPHGTLHLPDWINEDYCRQLTAEVLIDPQAEAKGKAKRALLERPGDHREWRKLPGRKNEALDEVVGAKALAWQEGAGQISASRWEELVAAAHRPPKPVTPDLFARPDLTESAQPKPEPAAPEQKPSSWVSPRRGWLQR
jgi:phage terminase large subunit GpA-like protein